MPKSWYSIKAREPGDSTAEISIFDEIGYWGVTAREFLADLKAIDAPKVKLLINSPGGSVFDALAMFNGLRTSGKEIEVQVLGIAASAASYLAMAGDTVTMPENTFMFLHNPISGVYGNAEDMREMAEILDKIGASLTGAYAKRWTGEPEALTQTLAEETYLTAAECLELGLCDEVTPAVTATAVFDADRMPDHVRAVLHPEGAPTPSVPPPPTVEPAPLPTPLAQTVEAIAQAAGLSATMAKAIGLDAKVTDDSAARQAVAQALEIAAFAKLAGHEERAEALVCARISVEEARAALAAAMQAEDQATFVDTAPPPKPIKPVGGVSATSLWATVKANEARSIIK